MRRQAISVDRILARIHSKRMQKFLGHTNIPYLIARASKNIEYKKSIQEERRNQKVEQTTLFEFEK